MRLRDSKPGVAFPTGSDTKRESPDFGVDLRGRMGFKRPRRGGRVVEGTPLLRAQMVKNRLEGSNPFFSAITLIVIYFNNLGATI
jgi:hypothetical protein